MTTKLATKHGLIDTKTLFYLTHRKGNHIFKKYNGFGFSVEEIRKAINYNCSIIRVKYFTRDFNYIYQVEIQQLLTSGITFTYNGDKQYIGRFDIELKLIGTEEVKEGEVYLGYRDFWKEYKQA